MRKRGSVVVIVALVAVHLTVVAPITAAAEQPTPYPGGRWEPPPEQYGTVQDSNLEVRMSDSTALKADVVYPTDPVTGARLPGPFPVLLQQDLYSGGPLAAASQGVVPADYYVKRGYIFVHVHDRGTGGSEGSMDATFGPRVGLDGVEFAYWAADPTNVPGSNGRVGLQGCSALGVVQLSTLAQLGELFRNQANVYVPGATKNDPGHYVPAAPESNPIKAAIPECSAPSLFHNKFFDNGVGSIIWALAAGQAAAQPALIGYNTHDPTSNVQYATMSVDYFAGGDAGYYLQFWRDRDYIRRAADIGLTGAAVLTWGGFGEAAFVGDQPLYAALQNYAAGLPVHAPMTPGQPVSPRYRAIVGDWGHGGGLDKGIELEWYETWLRGVDTGLQSAASSIHLQELTPSGSPRWINAPTYPMTDEYGALYLDGGGALSPSAPRTGGADQVTWGAGPPLTYTGEPFAVDTTLLGPSAIRLWVESSNTNAQLFAELQDVAPDGTATRITFGSILGSRHRTDPERSWFAPNGLPVFPSLTLDRDDYLTPNTAAQLDIPLLPVTWRFEAGHRLQLMVATNAGLACEPSTVISDAPVGCVVSVPTAQSLVGGVYRILHDAAHPSLVSAALVPSSLIPDAASAPTPTSGGVAMPQDWGTTAQDAGP